MPSLDWAKTRKLNGYFYNFNLEDDVNLIICYCFQIYAEGEKEGVFRSRDQRSLYNVDRLTGQPWWTKESTTYGPFFDLLEANWLQIRDEGVALLSLESPEGFTDESEKLRDSGGWKQYELFAQGRKNVAHCNKVKLYTFNLYSLAP